MNAPRNTDLGETRTYPFPLTHRMDLPLPTGGLNPGARQYWDYPVPVPGSKLARLDLVQGNAKGIKPTEAALFTITLTDANGNELHKDIPLLMVCPLILVPSTRTYRPRYFKPFHWDPFKSYVTPYQAFTAPSIQLLAYFTK